MSNICYTAQHLPCYKSYILKALFHRKNNSPSFLLNLQGNKSFVLTKVTMDTLGMDCAMKLARLLRHPDPSLYSSTGSWKCEREDHI